MTASAASSGRRAFRPIDMAVGGVLPTTDGGGGVVVGGVAGGGVGGGGGRGGGGGGGGGVCARAGRGAGGLLPARAWARASRPDRQVNRRLRLASPGRGPAGRPVAARGSPVGRPAFLIGRLPCLLALRRLTLHRVRRSIGRYLLRP